MASRKTWIWIVAGTLGACLMVLIAIAGAGVYFVTRHIQTERLTSTEALNAFELVGARFPDRRPLYALDGSDRPHLARPLQEMPTSAVKPAHMRILAWSPDEGRLVNVSLPLWVVKFGKHKFHIRHAGDGFDLDRLNLDVVELERIGPALVFDLRDHDGARVLVWTQ